MVGDQSSDLDGYIGILQESRSACAMLMHGRYMSLVTGAYLTENQVKEQLSYAYLHALACRLGFHCRGGPNPDMDSVDAEIRSKGMLADDSSLPGPQLSIQLKATARAIDTTQDFTYQLKKKNFNDLCGRHHVPKLLVLFVLPEEDDDWIDINAERLITRKCAFWHSLRDCEPIDAGSRVVTISHNNIFDTVALHEIMLKISKEEAI